MGGNKLDKYLVFLKLNTDIEDGWGGALSSMKSFMSKSLNQMQEMTNKKLSGLNVEVLQLRRQNTLIQNRLEDMQNNFEDMKNRMAKEKKDFSRQTETIIAASKELKENSIWSKKAISKLLGENNISMEDQ